jgi:hypothetical protein
MTGRLAVARTSGVRATVLACAVICLVGAAPAAAQEPANGFAVSIEGSGTITRDGDYAFTQSDIQENGTVSTDGSYEFAGATMMDVYFPTAGTNKHTANFLPDPARSSFTGQIQATENYEDNSPRTESSSCTAPYNDPNDRIFPLAYRGAGGSSIEVLVAPAVQANRDSTAIDCDDAYGVDQLLFPTQGSFDGQSVEPNPVWEDTVRVTLTQAQLNRDSFSVPLTFTSSGASTWAQGEEPPDTYCDFGVPAGNSGGCTWNHTWTGTLRFERTCSAAQGGQVQMPNSFVGRDGVERFFTSGFCLKDGGGDSCVVPKVVGKTVKKAKKKLKGANCKLGKVKKVPSSKKDKGLIVKQKPKPKTVKPAGAAVKVKVGKG